MLYKFQKIVYFSLDLSFPSIIIIVIHLSHWRFWGPCTCHNDSHIFCSAEKSIACLLLTNNLLSFFFLIKNAGRGNQWNYSPWAWPSRFPPAVKCSVWTIAIVLEDEFVTTAPPKCKLVKPFLNSIWFADYYCKRIRTRDR
jgi:hypothetical protein